MSNYINVQVVKPLGVEHDYTDFEMKELAKCQGSLAYFALNYIKVVHPVRGLINWEPRKYQLRMIDALLKDRFVVMLTPRQVGKSTLSMIYLLWKAIFTPNLDIAVLANKFKASQEILERIKEAYENLPMWLKPGAGSYNRMSIEFENGSRITCNSTSKDSIRGRSCSIVFLDEFAHVPSNIATEFWTANYPTISTGGQIIIVSTPNGVGNLFHETWKKAEAKENNFQPVRVDWWEVPGRDDAWKEATIRELGSIILFNQEYNNAFIGSVNTLIDYKTLELLTGKAPIEDSGSLRVWRRPEPDHEYVISVDVSEGKNQDGHALQVYDITTIPWTQVAVFSDNNTALVDIPYKIKELADMYNHAFVIAESNSIGKGVLNDLFFDLGYDRVVKMMKDPAELGVFSTKGSKAEACGMMKKAIENGWVVVNDMLTVNELLDFGAKNGVYKGLTGKDDLAMSLAWACYFNGADEYKYLGNSDKIQWFDFKAGKGVIENNKFDKMFHQDEITELEFIKMIKSARQTEEDEMLQWLMS